MDQWIITIKITIRAWKKRCCAVCLSPSNFYGAQQARLPKPPQIKSQSLSTFGGGGFLWAGCPFWRSNNSVKAVEAIKQTQVVTWRDLSRYPVVGRTRLSLVSLDQVYYKRIHTSRTKHTHTFNFRYIIIQKYTHKNTCVLHTQYTNSSVLFNQPYFSLVSPVQAGFPTQITS